MTCYSVQWTASAQQDLTEIIHYIAMDSTATALQQLDKLQLRAENLNQHPNRGRIVPELMAIGITHYRELVIRPWRMIYRVAGKSVYVIALLDSRRKLEDILLQRLIQIE